MGLDTVELVLRAEELYATTFTDDEAGQVSTVGDFYRLICAKLDLAALADASTSDALPVITAIEGRFFQRHTSLPSPPEVLPWSPQSVWDTLVAIFVDQMLLEPDEIHYSARIVQDLGID